MQPQQKQALSPAASKGRLWENPLFVGIITSISSILLTLLVTNILPGVYQTPMQIAELSKDIESLQQEIKRESDKRSNDIRYLLQSTSEDIQELWIQINGISQRLGMPVDLSPTDEMKTAITNDYVISSLNVSGSTELRATDTIAYSVITGQEYTVDQLASQKLLLPYISGSQEVYFYGQLSDGGRWDGHCIINVYENNKLVFVRDAQYDDGYLVRSKAVFSYTIKKGQDVWAISDRINNDSYSSGETTLYAWKSDFKQNFAFDTVSPANILSADNIRSILEAESYLYAYYYGDISDGWFNDETGSAYMIYFFEDGTVKQLYMGNFKNGTYEDNTGNAWFILREEDTDYMFFKGSFSGGKHLRDGNHKFESLGPPLSLDEINELIAGKHFNIELDWSADAFH